MRIVQMLVAAGVCGAVAAGLSGRPAAATCSVFYRHPCNPTSCSVFQRRPCVPYYDFWIGEDLRLTITSANARPVAPHGADDPRSWENKLHSIRDMFAALRACWMPPDEDQSQSGMQMSVRFAFKRDGEIVAPPRVTYTTPDASPEVRETYHQAIMEALQRCTPLPLSDGLGGAIAGRPIAIRFVDDRTRQDEHP